ncbi:MAG: 2-hydroxychromene-2-carboxylate isomerase [Polyangiaceae bacterium]|nr:2-hydroxychromene-2-carboxylate isomerase [Polyangiaceae bacterium]
MLPVEMYFDYASPWAYLASEIVARRLPGVPLTLRPIYIRGLESFSQGVPYSPTKLSYIARDLSRCMAHEGVRFTPPPVFPINGLYALRAALSAERDGSLDVLHPALFRAAWAEGRDLSSKAVVAELARGLGLGAVADGLDDPEVKAELKTRTDAAVALGIFGVPTFAVAGDLFWGHDRMDYVLRAASEPQ